MARNVTILLAAQAVSYLLALFYMIYAARYFGPANYGIITFSITFTGVFAILADFGLQQLTVREIVRHREQAASYVANAIILRVVLAALAYGLIALIINLMGYPPETRILVYLMGFSVILASFSQLFFSIFQAHEKMEFQAAGQVLQVLLTFIGILIVINQNLGLIYIGYVFIAASLLTLLYCLLVMRVRSSFKGDTFFAAKTGIGWGSIKAILRDALPFGIVVICASLYYSVDSIVISYTQGDAPLGYYGAAYKIMQALLFLPAMWGVSVFPVMVTLHASARSSLVFGVERSVKYLSIIALPAAVALTILAARVIQVTFGIEYSQSAIALQILAWAMAPLYLSVCFAVFLQSTNNQGLYTKILAFCTILNILLNIIFVPAFSFLAASIILLLTSLMLLVILCIYCLQVERSFNIGGIILSLVKVSFSSLIMGVYVYLFQQWNLLLLIPSALLVYAFATLIMRILDKEDWSILRLKTK